MSAGHVRGYLFSGFVLLMLVVVVAFWFAYETRVSAAASQTLLVDEQRIAAVQGAVRQAETGQRGFLLTGNPAYLTQYTSALPLVPARLQALHAALGKGPEAANVTQLGKLAAIKLDELARTISLYQSGRRDAALALVNTNLGENVMDQLRAVVSRMQDEQSAELDRRRRVDMRDGMLLQLTTSLAVVFTLLLTWLAVRENRVRNGQLRAAQRQLLEANATLERRVEERTATLRESERALAEANASLEQRVAERSRELDQIFRLSVDLLV